MWFLFCLIHHFKVSPVHFYVCSDTQTHGWIQTCHYDVCIWNWRITRSTCFSLGSIDCTSATLASAVLAICVALQFEASLNKLDPTYNVYCEQRHSVWNVNSSGNSRATADLGANQWVKDKTNDFKHLIVAHTLLRSCRKVFHLFAMPAMVSFLLKHDSEREKTEQTRKQRQLIENWMWILWQRCTFWGNLC